MASLSLSHLQLRHRRVGSLRPADGVAHEIPQALPETSLRSDLRYLTQLLLTSLPLMAADLFAIVVATTLVAAVGPWLFPAFTMPVLTQAIPMMAAFLIAAAFVGLYPGVGLNTVAEIRLSALASTLWFLVFLLATIVIDDHQIATELRLIGMWPMLLVVVPLARRVARHWAARRTWWGQPTLIFGGGEQGALTYHLLSEHRAMGLRPVGIVDDLHRLWGDRDWDDSQLNPHWYLGPFASTPELIEEHSVSWGVVAMSGRPADETAQLIDGYACSIPHLLLLPDAVQRSRGCDVWHDSIGFDRCRLDARLLLPGARFTKRVMDLVLTVVGGVMILPLLATVASAVRFTSPGPIFYSQERIGRGGRRFSAWKFRTMVMNADQVLTHYLNAHPELRAEWERDHKLKHDPRVTWIGRLLRKTSLDELPQLWNVLRGEMSLVGPRPIVQAEIPKYSSVYPIYLRVLPGISGLWQVSGRNNTTYEERVAYDDCYVRNWSPWLDIVLLVRTIKVVLFREGAY